MSFSDWIRRRMGNQHRRKGYTFQGMDVLFLTTTGARSGDKREAPVARFPDGDDAWLIVASSGGRAHNPSWYHNLLAHPDEVSIELPDRKLDVTATELEGAEREERWQRIVAAQPRFGGYQKKTDRRLPVIRLTPAKP
jgi:deazaflavin-dependent oxidoreductase (nitroreductase family)